MIKSGLVSVSFRRLSVDEVIELTARAGLSSIEWGGDFHVPPGDESIAQRVSEATRMSGLSVSAYGSYYRAGAYDDPVCECDRILKTARFLQAPLIRIWAGDRASADANDGWFERVAEQSRILCKKALEHGIRTAWEYHTDTLTDNMDCTDRLLCAVSDMLVYWQPPAGWGIQKNLEGIARIAKRLANIHVYHWLGSDRRPLEEGVPAWQDYFDALAAIPGDRFASLEFVRFDREDQLVRDALTLNRLLKNCGPSGL